MTRGQEASFGGHAAPLVSIIINNYNYARFLVESIESALSQTYPRVEVVVVDDASIDDSRDVIRRYGERVVPVLRERNGGHGAAFNTGLGASRGDIVVFLDADDHLYPGAAARIVASWTPGISKVQYRLHLVDAKGEVIDLFPAPEVRFDSGNVVPLLLRFGRYETTVTSGNAFARATLERVMPMPEGEFSMGADGYLVTVAPFHGPVVSIDEPLGAYRLHGGNSWALVDHPLVDRLHRWLSHDASRFRALAEKAQAMGMEAPAGLGMRDHHHLAMRLASICLDRAHHPYPGDSRIVLALRGASSSRHARLSRSRRLILAAWFLATGVLPIPLALTALHWRLAPYTRPPGVARALKAVRRVAG